MAEDDRAGTEGCAEERCFFPFIARHFVDAENEFWRAMRCNGAPMPQHGFVRDAKFSVIEGEQENSLRMRYVDSEMTRSYYPFAFQFDVVVNLLPSSRLEVRFETSNPGDKPLPYGHHFFLPVPHIRNVPTGLCIFPVNRGHQSPGGSIIHEKAAGKLLWLTIRHRFQISFNSKICGCVKMRKNGAEVDL